MFFPITIQSLLACERLCLIKLDECNILQRDHLVKNRLSPECTVPSALKTLVSHDSNFSSVKLMGHTTNEHLAQLELRENPSTLSDSKTPIPQLDQGFECLVRQAQDLCHTTKTLRPSYTQEKSLAQ
jgi:hypothetical protein